MSVSVSEAEPQPKSQPQQQPRSVRLVLMALLIAMMLAMLDNMIIGTAMPTIVGDLGGVEHLSWVVTAYTLATAASTPIWGKVGDLYGRKGAFLSSIVLFLIGSALSGLAQDMAQLIGFRALQGLGAGGLMVGVMAIIGDLIPPRERGRYQGMIAAVMAVAMIGGPSLGGFITDHWGWRWTFYINIPLGGIALAMVTAVLHLPKRDRRSSGIDYVGAGLLTVGITAIVLLTTWGGTEYAWGSAMIIGLGVAGVAAIAAFLYAEWRAERTGSVEAVVPLHIFRNRNFALMSLIGFVLGFVLFGAMLYLPLFQQAVQGASATNSGLLLMPMLLAFMGISVVAGRLTTRTGRYKAFPIVGGVLMVTGMFLLAQMDTGTSRLTAGVYMAVLGAGMGFLMQITMLVAQNSVEMKDMGVASSTTTLFRTLGSSFGVAVMGALFTNQVDHEMAGRGGGAAAGSVRDSAQLTAEAMAALPPPVREAYEYAVASGTQVAFLLGAVVALVAFAAALFVREVPLRGAGPGSAPGPGAKPEAEAPAAEPEQTPAAPVAS